ncbi:MAG: multidrug efflux SMR transporter [Neptuniibacter sp.]
MKNWLFLTIAIIAEVIGTSALKASEGFTNPIPSILVVLGYGLAFYFLSLTLQTIPIGVTYAIWSGLGIVLITLVGWGFFEQKIDTPAMIGMGFIIAGVVIMNMFSKVITH